MRSATHARSSNVIPIDGRPWRGWQHLLIALGALALPLSASAGGSGDTLRVSLTSDIRSTNPGVNRDANTDTVMMHVLEGLVAYREDGSVGPLLAESIEVSTDGTEYTFRLRPQVPFHNGALLTADDVVWSWRRYLDPATGWSCLSDFDGSRGHRIESVTAVAVDRVVFKLNRPQPLFLSQMAAIQCGGGAILHRSSLNADGSWNAPVATGPYRLETWKRGQYIDLRAFDGYRSRSGPRDGNTGGKIASAAHVRWLIIRDSAARLAALVKGQVDVMPEVPAAETVQLRRMPGITLIAKPMLVNYAILIQDQAPPLGDVRIRRALALSLDRTAIAALVTNEVGVANPSVIPSSSPYHSKQHFAGGEPDVPQARALLAQAGYRGAPIVLTTNRRYPAMFNQALLVQAMARQAGINLQLEVLEWATQLDRWKSGKYQLMSFGFTARADPYLNYDAMLGDRSRSHTKLWDNPVALELQRAAGESSDRLTRQQLFDRMHELMIADCPLIVLYSLSDVNAVRSGVSGFDSWVFGRARLWGVRPASS
ncbi:ABC transporter substrate-binding protein [Peristeroidobacter soli]|uniref:ABC transporter substrate-binding protein n=1 Tax=Peristeroidobacter soli TaxID=2497877 RepID=UPI00101DA402|nr:ABC transporter substrate-binding protein [Peristeroidobacter soli]